MKILCRFNSVLEKQDFMGIGHCSFKMYLNLRQPQAILRSCFRHSPSPLDVGGPDTPGEAAGSRASRCPVVAGPLGYEMHFSSVLSRNWSFSSLGLQRSTPFLLRNPASPDAQVFLSRNEWPEVTGRSLWEERVRSSPSWSQGFTAASRFAEGSRQSKARS